MKYDLNKLIMIGKPTRSMYMSAVAQSSSWKDETLIHLYMNINGQINKERFDIDKSIWKSMKGISKPTDKEFLAYSYILGKGVPRDFNKAFEVYPVRENPICRYTTWLNNGKGISVEKLLFGEEEK